jgi:hypothetical protein
MSYENKLAEGVTLLSETDDSFVKQVTPWQIMKEQLADDPARKSPAIDVKREFETAKARSK